MLNKLRLHGEVWLAADIHLGPNGPKTAAAFYQFLQQASQQSNALILCGDIFNSWIGADYALNPPHWLEQAITHFKKTTTELPIFFMRGNRDFLLDTHFAKSVGAQLLDDQLILQTDHVQLLLTHGDELCTDDLAYQAFRKKVRGKKLQQFFLKLPLSWRLRIAGGLRKQSGKKQKEMAISISDVNEFSCMQLLRHHHQHLLVHGHTHRPDLHKMQDQNGKKYTRLVIPDWEYDYSQPTRSGWVALQADGQIALHRLHQPTLRFKLKDASLTT